MTSEFEKKMRGRNELSLIPEDRRAVTSDVARLQPTEIRTSISPSSAVKLNKTSALANYATEAAYVTMGTTYTLNNHSLHFKGTSLLHFRVEIIANWTVLGETAALSSQLVFLMRNILQIVNTLVTCSRRKEKASERMGWWEGRTMMRGDGPVKERCFGRKLPNLSGAGGELRRTDALRCGFGRMGRYSLQVVVT
uniref:Uncharacterized protein n=1 Tax=Timema monikensis TaxID=170555 RepID=A0A7R9DY56_9NEOP|nr:unnamed protein product [Timema monikensis]